MIDVDLDPDRARQAIAGAALHTPTIPCPDLAEPPAEPPAAEPAKVALKAECLQSAGSFKLRGVLSKLASLAEGGRGSHPGLVTASAGNHGRAVAHAARLKGVSATVFMPSDAPVSKVAAVERLGARVHLQGSSVEEALALAYACSEQTGAALVHPFDDLDVIAGQATIGLELLEDVPDLARVVVPVGGGGLAAGIAIALQRAPRPVEIVAVQARACAPYVRALASAESPATTPAGDGAASAGSAARAREASVDVGEPAPGATIADGIAIKRPGRITLPLLRELVHRVETVSEDEIADAMVFLVERAKLVAEGAGAVAVAALRSGRLQPADGTTVAIVSGGNVDSGLLAGLLRRRETEEGRRVRVFTRVADRPGGLAELLALVAGTRANVVSVEHVREAVHLHVRETGIALTLETRGPDHTDEVLAALRDASYPLSFE